jgi:hypothetical protein
MPQAMSTVREGWGTLVVEVEVAGSEDELDELEIGTR